MSLRRPMVRDANGRRVPLVPTDTFVVGRPEAAARRDRILAAAPSTPLTRDEKRRFILLWAAATPIVVGTGVLGPFLLDVSRWWTFLFFLPMAVLPAALTIFVSRRAVAQRIAETYVRAGVCGSCGYELAGAPADPDGVVTCPECGAAWRRAIGDEPNR